METNVKVKIDRRKLARDLTKMLGNNLNKYIAEIILNSDDSYKRLEKKNPDDYILPCPIYIKFDRKNRIITIIDNAEGMSATELNNNFSVYGKDTSGGNETVGVRGLFGQGASDILFAASFYKKQAEIISIKNNIVSKCFFKVNDDMEKELKVTELKIHKNQLRSIRKKYYIPLNGTVVIFGVPDKIKIPSKDKLKEYIESFYMFRFLLSNEERKVILIDGNRDTVLKHNSIKLLEDDYFYKNDFFSFKYSDHVLECKLNLYKVEAGHKESGKVLVHDEEGTVYDNTLFEVGSKALGAECLSGTLEINNLSFLLREYLNKEKPEEILTESRDGFDKKHDFYQNLSSLMEYYINSGLKNINKENKGPVSSAILNKKIIEAFKKINKYFKEHSDEEIGGPLEGSTPPAEGLRFVRPEIRISLNKIYSIKLLINIEIIGIGKKINFNCCQDQFIKILSEKHQTITEIDKQDDKLAVKSIRIEALKPTKLSPIKITVSSGECNANLFVNVIEKEIHEPLNGLEFFPSTITTSKDGSSNLHLYFDIRYIPLGSKIVITSDEGIFFKKRELICGKENLLSEYVGLIECQFNGGTTNTDYSVSAAFGETYSNALIRIRDKNEKELGGAGKFTYPKFDSSNQFWQSYYNNNTGEIIINSANIINYSYFGEVREYPQMSKNQKKYFCELIACECAKELAKVKQLKGQITDYEDFLDEIQREKNKIYGIFEL